MKGLKTSVPVKQHVKVIRRQKDPQIPLPFFPRSTGINFFRQPGLREDAEGIDAVEICTVARGVCEIEQHGKMVRLSAGESLYKMPGEHRRKRVLSPDGAEIYWVTFDGKGAVEFMKSYGYPAGALPTGECPVELYNEICRLLISGTEGAFRKMIPLYAELIARLPGSEVQTETGNQLLLECQQLILTNFSDPDFNIDALAEISGMHRTTLFRIFRRELDTTPQEYLMQCRIDHAVYLLQTTLIPVNIIAESSGFKRSNYFCRIIRSRCGRTPEQLRKHAVYGN